MSTMIGWQNWSLRRSISCNYFLILLFALSIAQCNAQIPDDVTRGHYFDTNTYANGDQFWTNLNKVLGDLFLNPPSTGVNVSSYGVSPNKVYGLLQCRGDASQKECYDCCQNARNNVYSSCKNNVGCQMWSLMCELYYQNDSSSIRPTGARGYDSNQFLKEMKGKEMPFRNLVSNLSIGASTSIKRFAAGKSVDSSGHNIYALVQCYRDISISNCSNCLANAMKKLQTEKYVYSAIYWDRCYVMLSNQSLSATNQSGKLPMSLGIGRAMLLLMSCAMLLLLM